MGNGEQVSDLGFFPSWVQDATDPLEKKIRRWGIKCMLRQRGISYEELADYMNVSRQRVGQMVGELVGQDEDRLNEAITAITEQKHKAMGHTDDDPSCTVISVGMRNYAEPLRQQKISEAQELAVEMRLAFANEPKVDENGIEWEDVDA